MDPIIKTLKDRYFQWQAALQEPNENNLHSRVESAYLSYLWGLDPATISAEWRVEVMDLQEAESSCPPEWAPRLTEARKAVFG